MCCLLHVFAEMAYQYWDYLVVLRLIWWISFRIIMVFFKFPKDSSKDTCIAKIRIIIIPRTLWMLMFGRFLNHMNVCPWAKPPSFLQTVEKIPILRSSFFPVRPDFSDMLYFHMPQKPKGPPRAPTSNATFLPSWTVAKKGLSQVKVNGGLLNPLRPYLLGRNVALGELYRFSWKRAGDLWSSAVSTQRHGNDGGPRWWDLLGES